MIRPQPLLLLLALALTACSIRTKHRAVALIVEKDVCFSGSTDMRLTKAFKPGRRVGYEWELQLLNEWPKKPSWWDATPDVLKVPGSAHVSIGDVETMWDFENGHRLEIYGVAHFGGSDYPFRYQRFAAEPIDAQKAIQNMFQGCAH